MYFLIFWTCPHKLLILYRIQNAPYLKKNDYRTCMTQDSEPKTQDPNTQDQDKDIRPKSWQIACSTYCTAIQGESPWRSNPLN